MCVWYGTIVVVGMVLLGTASDQLIVEPLELRCA